MGNKSSIVKHPEYDRTYEKEEMSIISFSGQRHTLERTNKKGIPFVGKCILCGEENLEGRVS